MTIFSEDGGKNCYDSARKFTRMLVEVCMLRYAAQASSETTGARDGNRTHDPSLTKTVRYRCATRASFFCLVGSGGFEPPKLAQLIYSQSHLATLVTALIRLLK